MQFSYIVLTFLPISNSETRFYVRGIKPMASDRIRRNFIFANRDHAIKILKK